MLDVYLLFIDEDLVVLYSYSFIKLFKRWYCICTIFDRNLDLPLVFGPKNNYGRARNTIKKGEGARQIVDDISERITKKNNHRKREYILWGCNCNVLKFEEVMMSKIIKA